MKDCPGVRSPCAICPTPTECLERTEKQVTEVSPQSTKLHNIEDILKKFITRETHQGSHARVVVQLAGILAERERASYEAGKDAAYAAMANTASDALKEAAREAALSILKAVEEAYAMNGLEEAAFNMLVAAKNAARPYIDLAKEE